MKTLTQFTYKFSKDNTPIDYADPGETVKFVTKDCFEGFVTEDSDVPYHADYSHSNPTTGPLYINGAEPGDVLAVDILDVEVADHGAVIICEDCGPLWKNSEPRTRILQIEDGQAIYKDVKIPINPMVGTIGVAPNGEDIPSAHASNCGGNMDSNIITKGVTVWLPVRVSGGLLAMGDIHACMADGEVVGTGLEVDGEITVRVRLLKNFELNWAMTETEDAWYVNTNAPTCDEAITFGYLEMQRLIAQAYDWDMSDASMYMTLTGDLSANQACIEPTAGGNTFRVGTPKQPNKKGLLFGEILG